MPAFTTIALGALAAAGIGGSIYSGQQQAKAQRKSLRAQEEAQRQAEALAISEKRKADADFARANQKAPDVGSLLSTAKEAATIGTAQTMLTGAKGVKRKDLPLLGGEASLLGE